MDDLAKAYFLDVKREEMKKGYIEAVDMAYSNDEVAIHKAFVMMSYTVEKIMSNEDYKELSEYHKKARQENFEEKQKMFNTYLKGIKRSLKNGFSTRL